MRDERRDQVFTAHVLLCLHKHDVNTMIRVSSGNGVVRYGVGNRGRIPGKG
jgi:hypothetical protein